MLASSLDSIGKNMDCEEQSTTSLLDIVIKWNGNDYDVKNLNVKSDVKTLKEEIFKCTGVRPERQKLINLRISGYYNYRFVYYTHVHVLTLLFLFRIVIEKVYIVLL